MRLFVDCPDRLTDWLPAGQHWVPGNAESLFPQERQLWSALAGTSTLWLLPEIALAGPFWARLIIIGEAPSSQFDAINELLRNGLTLTEPMACLALAGRGFHGQRGRAWAASPGNLHLIAALPGDLPVEHAAALTALPAVAAAKAIHTLSKGELSAGIKWINDILISGRKVAGVITSTQVLGHSITQVVYGIGVNVAGAPVVAPTLTVPEVGSLAGAGLNVSLREVLIQLLAGIERLCRSLVHNGPPSVLEAYRSYSLVIGREVCIFEDSIEDEPRDAAGPECLIARGVVRDILPDLTLHIDGVSEPVARGRLVFA